MAMTRTQVPGYGEVLSFTTLHSPPTGFASPLHMALVEMEGGTRFFCHGTGTRGLKVGSRVSIEAVDQIYYFSMLSMGERAVTSGRTPLRPVLGRLVLGPVLGRLGLG